MEDTAGWRPDPTGRHTERYFRSPGIPTNRVRNDGIESIDEGPSSRGRASIAISGTDQIAAPAPDPSRAIAQNGMSPTGPTLVSVYKEPVVDKIRPQASAGNEEAGPARPTVVVVRERSWWLVASACVLLVLLAAATAFAVQQHGAANKWEHQYRAAVTNYHAAAHKNVGLYSSLVLMQQRFATCASDANRILFDLDADFGRGFLPPTSKSDAATAGQACHTTAQPSGT